ncbi:hypothetical protein CLOM_g7696 [Closterium sp. NIES-68]|nr:hypothetical protein CLOM_g7696 [Closterium sp. NIES-68]GJP61871.1 hypothetical protein CLOP_g18990 [Closterium sp. NIES-67]
MAAALRGNPPFLTPRYADERGRCGPVAAANPPPSDAFSRNRKLPGGEMSLEKVVARSALFTGRLPSFRRCGTQEDSRSRSQSGLVSVRYPSVVCRAGSGKGWTSDQSPYETLGVERDAGENEIKSAYRRLVKRFHPDVYDAASSGGEEGGAESGSERESAEARFIRIQAAYELLLDGEERRQYDLDNRVDPMKASRAWVEWVQRKKRAFDQRGDMAMSAWAEQQQRELNLRARQLSKEKSDPDERRILARERAAAMETTEKVVRRHSLVLKKRDIERQRAEEAAKKRLVAELLALEGFEVEEEEGGAREGRGQLPWGS